ncbi:MAG TPA: glutamine amidotransferase [Tepidisphaeraceae bacterium]|jgi:uncharacterized membrane protein
MRVIQHILAKIALLLDGEWGMLSARVGEVHWTFASAGTGIIIVAAVIGLIMAALCYYRTTEGLSARARVALALLRFGAIVALAVMVSGAVCTLDVARNEQPQLLVLVDDSPSMMLPAGGDVAGTRLEMAQKALDDGLLKKLKKNYDVRVERTSQAAAGASADSAQDLATAIVRESSKPPLPTDRPLSQILVISDGVQLGSHALSRAAAEVPAPVSTLSVGTADVKDVVLQDVSVPPYVYQNDRAVVTAEVGSIGTPPGGEAVVQLAEIKGEGETPVTSTKVTLKGWDDPAIARLEFVAPKAGLGRYVVRVMPVKGELTEKNNAAAFHLDVRQEKIRVFFVEGQPSWEYKFVKEALESDPVVEFHGLVRLPGEEWFYQGSQNRPDGKAVVANPKQGFPGTADELNYFDVMILGDLERKIFENGGRFDLLEQFVKNHGGGLATIGGMHVYGAGDYEGTRLADMVPFEIEKEKKQQLINRFQPAVTTQGMMHPLMQLEFDPVLNEQAWAKLPWVEGGNAIRAIKSSATLLMVHPTLKTHYGARPVAAAWQYGQGKVYSSALDGTWHWRTARESETDYHKRFWGLVVRWLASDPRTKQPVGSLIVEDPVLEVGKRATFYVNMRDESGGPVTDAQAEFSIAGASGKPLLARSSSDPAVPGRYAVSFEPQEAGEITVNAMVMRGSQEPVKQEQKYLVAPSRAEYLEVRPDAKALAELSKLSGGVSGSLAHPEQFQMPAEAGSVRVQKVVVSLWQAPGLLAVLVGCLFVEWMMRKRRGLS